MIKNKFESPYETLSLKKSHGWNVLIILSKYGTNVIFSESSDKVHPICAGLLINKQPTSTQNGYKDYLHVN